MVVDATSMSSPPLRQRSRVTSTSSPGRGRGAGRSAARGDGAVGCRPRGARAALPPRRVRRATASSGSRAGSPRSACSRPGRRRRRRLPAPARDGRGSQGLRLFELGDPARRPEELELAAARRARAAGDKLWFYGGREQMELLERVLDDAARADGRAQPPRLLAAGLFVPTSTAGRASSAATRREGLAAVAVSRALPRRPRPPLRLYAFAPSRAPYDDLRPVDRGAARRVRAASDCCSARTSRGSRAEPGYARDARRDRRHLAVSRRADRAPRPRRQRGATSSAFDEPRRALPHDAA